MHIKAIYSRTVYPQRIIGRHQVDDHDGNNVYNRHQSARRISHLMLMQEKQNQALNGAIDNLESRRSRQFNRKYFE